MPLYQYLADCLGIFSLSLLVTLLTTPLSIRLGVRAGLLDVPTERRVHSRIIARSGGLAVIFGFYCGAAAISLLWPSYQGGLGPAWLRAFSVAAAVIILTGLYDDKQGLSATGKLFGQLCAALTMLLLSGQTFGSILGFGVPAWMDYLLTLFWFLAVTNAFNLIDGLDGLCAGITMISALGLAVSFIIRGMLGDSLVCFALVGAALAFLYYNFHPAKVFLGDTGSMFCGFCLAAMALQTNGKSTFLVTAGIPLLAAGVPAIDMMLAVWRRSARAMLVRGNGGGVMHADLEHLHHRLLALGLNQRQVAFVLYFATLLCVLLGLLSVLGNRTGFGLFLIIFTGGVYVLIRHVVHVELWDTAKVLLSRVDITPRRGFVTLFFYPLWDLLWLSGSFLFAFWLMIKLTLSNDGAYHLLSELAVWLPCPYIALVASNTYYKVWFHASINDYFELILAIVSGTVLSLAIVLLLQRDITFFRIVLALLFCLFSAAGVMGIRMVIPLSRQWMLTTQRYRLLENAPPVQLALLYGGGRRCGLFMREMHLSRQQETGNLRVVGIIDDCRFLRKRIVHGLCILGGFDELEYVVETYQIDKIIVTTDLDRLALQRLQQFCARKNIALSSWGSSLTPLSSSFSPYHPPNQ